MADKKKLYLELTIRCYVEDSEDQTNTKITIDTEHNKPSVSYEINASKLERPLLGLGGLNAECIAPNELKESLLLLFEAKIIELVYKFGFYSRWKIDDLSLSKDNEEDTHNNKALIRDYMESRFKHMFRESVYQYEAKSSPTYEKPGRPNKWGLDPWMVTLIDPDYERYYLFYKQLLKDYHAIYKKNVSNDKRNTQQTVEDYIKDCITKTCDRLKEKYIKLNKTLPNSDDINWAIEVADLKDSKNGPRERAWETVKKEHGLEEDIPFRTWSFARNRMRQQVENDGE